MHFKVYLLLYTHLFFIRCSNAVNITTILSQHPSFSTFNHFLSQTQLAAEINSRQTITVLAVPNHAVSPLSGKTDDVLKNLLRVHVVLDYFDVEKLRNLPNTTAQMTTLFQTTGQALGQQGFLKATVMKTQSVVIRSATQDSPLGAVLVGSVAAEACNISVIHISKPIVPVGMDGEVLVSDSDSSSTSRVEPPTPSPSHSPKMSLVPTPGPAPSAKTTPQPPVYMPAHSPKMSLVPTPGPAHGAKISTPPVYMPAHSPKMSLVPTPGPAHSSKSTQPPVYMPVHSPKMSPPPACTPKAVPSMAPKPLPRSPNAPGESPVPAGAPTTEAPEYPADASESPPKPIYTPTESPPEVADAPAGPPTTPADAENASSSTLNLRIVLGVVTTIVLSSIHLVFKI